MPDTSQTLFKGIALVVDDEHTVLRLVTTVLASAGFRPVVAENGITGFEAYLGISSEVAFILTDVAMPGASGLDLASRILEINPTAKILVMSGYSDTPLEREARKRFPFIRKPFLPADLIKKIGEVMA
jgi:two-component system, cell cycle sensor histidine kinase and response regulator CckA